MPDARYDNPRPEGGFDAERLPAGKPAPTPAGSKAIPISDWRKQRFLEWLCTIVDDRKPKLMEDLAKELSLSRRTLTTWKVDPEFAAAWERKYRASIGSPERAQAVMETLYKTATDEDDPKHVQAAKQYLEAIDAIKPQRVDVHVTGSAKDLTDEDLDRILATRANDELAARRQETG
jgi:hypothetical protein